MWQIQNSDSDELSKKNLGVWKVDGAVGNNQNTDWICSATGGAAGISLGDANESLSLSVENVGTDSLPSAGEQYVCGDAWKIYFPQTTGVFSMRLSVRVVQATATRIVWEPTFSIQTSLLDTAPSLSLTARGEPDDRVSEIAGVVNSAVSVFACRVRELGQVIVLLGPNDAPLTKNRCSQDALGPPDFW